jgi:hypothetical protein
MHFVIDFTAVISGPEKKITQYMHNDGCILVNYVEEIIQITLHVYIVS